MSFHEGPIARDAVILSMERKKSDEGAKKRQRVGFTKKKILCRQSGV
jgi:hypothetical protein